MKVLVVTNMYPSPSRPHWGAFVRSQVESLETLGVRHVLYEIEGWKSSWAYARALARLPAVAKRAEVDLVHAHYGTSAVSAWNVKVPLVVSFCGDDLLGRPDASGRISTKSRVLVGLSKAVARRAEAVIVKTEEMKRVLFPLPEVEVIPNGVDLARFAPEPREAARARLGWPANGKTLLFTGDRSEPRKNWPLAVEVEQRLRGRGYDVELRAFHGHSQDQVPDAMNASDVLILPSFHEGSPNVVKEAMAVGLPVVAAPVGDCLERLDGCVPGAVVDRKPEDFARAVAEILDQGQRSNGRERVAALEISVVAQRVRSVYERVLASGAKR